MDNDHPLIALIRNRIGQDDASPLYLKVAQTIRQAAQQRLLAGGDYLPTEREFSDRLGISRITVRKALEVLDWEGIVVRSRGRGTMISDTLEYSLQEAQGFSRQVMLNGKKPDTLWIKKDIIPSTEAIAAQLDLEPDAPVFFLKRVRYVDEKPVSIEESYVPAHLIPDPDAIQLSLYDYFRSRNIIPTHTRSRVSTHMPDADFLEKLKLTTPVPVLIIEQTAFDSRSTPIEFSVSRCRGDMYVFVTNA